MTFGKRIKFSFVFKSNGTWAFHFTFHFLFTLEPYRIQLLDNIIFFNQECWKKLFIPIFIILGSFFCETNQHFGSKTKTYFQCNRNPFDLTRSHYFLYSKKGDFFRKKNSGSDGCTPDRCRNQCRNQSRNVGINQCRNQCRNVWINQGM